MTDVVSDSCRKIVFREFLQFSKSKIIQNCKNNDSFQKYFWGEIIPLIEFIHTRQNRGSAFDDCNEWDSFRKRIFHIISYNSQKIFKIMIYICI